MERKKNKLSNSLGYLVFGITLIVSLCAFIAFLSIDAFNKPGPLVKSKLITIPRGASLSLISEILEHESAIDDALLFKLSVYALNEGKNLKAGEYRIRKHSKMYDVIKLLKNGVSFQRLITIPEGLTSYEIQEIVNNHEGLDGQSIKNIEPEGALLPETYSYQSGDTKSDILKRMKESMDKVKTWPASRLCPAIFNALSADERQAVSGNDICFNKYIKTWHDVITLASIVEKETSVAKERKKVSGVFVNRLKKGMPLQTDPTVIYAITQGRHQSDGMGPLGRRLLKADLNYDSPYNTYKYKGLPPGPIANPGVASILAVFSPAEHNYLYFVADGSGGHAFAQTLKAHNDNVAKWRKVRKAQ